MRRTISAIAGVILSMTVAGCGDSSPESGPVPFKATTSPAIDALRENMSKAAKDGTYTKKQAPAPDIKPAPEKKEAEKKN